MNSRFEVIHARKKLVQSMRLVSDDGLLTIDAIDRNGVVLAKLTFKSPLLVRIADEGARLRLWGELGEMRGLLLLDNESDLPGWVHREGFETRDVSNAKHFIVCAGEEVVDVVSIALPIVEVLEP
jgi:hypothetical protein